MDLNATQVGAGPAGLVLALSLLQNGVPVRIIDKSPEHPVGQRGSGIQVGRMHPVRSFLSRVCLTQFRFGPSLVQWNCIGPLVSWMIS